MNGDEFNTTAQGYTQNGTTVMNVAREVMDRFLGMPLKVMERLRRIDSILYQEPLQRNGSAGNPTLVPGPWGFLASGYFFGLFFMAFVLNRIQNIVVPPHRTMVFADDDQLRDLVSVQVWNTWGITWLESLGEWAKAKSMEEVCWFTFTTVCIALFVGSLTSGMEGFANNTPFNLFAYTFILYLYGSPITHTEKFKGAPARPDKQIIIAVMLPLFQLCLTHTMEVKQRWARYRLIPTSITSILSLIHFHLVLWVYPSSYPLPNYLPNLIESFLAATTVITISLNALTQLLLTGRIDKPLFGHQASLMPKLEEEFSTALFRLGTASLDATSVVGFGNEVGRVGVGQSSFATPTTGTTEDEQGFVEINRAGVQTVSPAHPRGGKKAPGGFGNEIKRVKASATHTEFWFESVVNTAWRRELGKFLKALWRAVKRVFYMKWLRRGGSEGIHTNMNSDPSSVPRSTAEATEEDVYDRFLRGETIDDENDPDFDPATPAQSSDEEDDYDDASDIDEDDNIDFVESEANETVSLYADLHDTASSGSTSAPLLLAHMTDTSASPLTRRRYSRIISHSQRETTPMRSGADDDWQTYVNRRRQEQLERHRSDDHQADRRSCVICTVEPREIICWPCRCLAICDDCRENLASRSAASKHLCPCCRRNVEGYSKIFIP
ncbi:hypothetical protein ABKN59_003979 [Abortiporus biennis]